MEHMRCSTDSYVLDGKGGDKTMDFVSFLLKVLVFISSVIRKRVCQAILCFIGVVPAFTRLLQ